MKIGIFKTYDQAFKRVIEACVDLNVAYEVIDILAPDWIERVRNSDCDGFFCPSTCASQEKKSILDERYFFVSQIMKRKIYPDFLGLFIHENKRNMSAWLQFSGFPHVPTKVFLERGQALEYVNSCRYPIVVKANLGAAASKVRILQNKRQARTYVRAVFPRWSNALSLLHIGKVYWSKVRGVRVPDLSAPQKDYVLLQDFRKITCEWRIIKIGNSYFGHQKLLKGHFASGSGKVGWVAPPENLLFLVKDICDAGGFVCMDVDIFETVEGEFLVNELQASFGSYADSQMYVNGVPGRFKWEHDHFVFEEGVFNVFGSNKLKVAAFIEILAHKTSAKQEQ